MKHKKKLLVLTPRFPYPVIGGDRLRIYQVCKALANRFSLTLVSLCETQAEMQTPVPDDGIFDHIERVLLTPQRSFLNTLMAIPGRTPLQVAYYQSPDFARIVENLLPEHDGVLSHLIRCSEYIRHSKKPKFLEMTDAISMNYQRIKNLNESTGIKGYIYKLESSRLGDYERDVIRDFDITILVSETDKSYLVGDDLKLNQRVIVCSNGVDLKNLPFRNRHDSNPVIVYIGNMASMQNMDACMYFAKDVMPLINQRMTATFRIVGKISDSDAARLRALPNVEVTGPVKDIASSVADARLGVCPVRLAAGVQNKVLEYMALGLPVVTSSIGLEGFSAKSGDDLLVADSPAEYVEQISRIWNDKKLSTSLSSNGRAYVEQQHDWAARLDPLVEKIYNRIINP